MSVWSYVCRELRHPGALCFITMIMNVNNASMITIIGIIIHPGALEQGEELDQDVDDEEGRAEAEHREDGGGVSQEEVGHLGHIFL